ncbi:hypothetical protein RH858_15885 [Halalkaliarchaeum sp. AArc-GB]|nr:MULTISPECIES: hypothetical protein [unclassified Halalkaliarchaeum]MDR5674607.1 hypothetical protein [Halalkaliarchaeum sp. AArc-GB]
MAASQHRTEETYRCPSCGGTLAYKQQSWQCRDCRFGPKHGAD